MDAATFIYKGAPTPMVEDWAFDDSAYSNFLAGVLHGSPRVAVQGLMYACLCFSLQVALLRIYAVGTWAYGVQNADKKGDGAFTDIMYASGDAGQMLAARTVCNIVCGGYSESAGS